MGIATLCYAEHPRLASGRELSGHKSQPCPQISGVLDTAGISDSRDECGGIQHADTGYPCQARHRAIFLGERCELRIQRLNLLVERSPFVPQLQDQASDARRQRDI